MAKKKKKSKFSPASAIELEYFSKLKKIAKNSAAIVYRHVDGFEVKDAGGMGKAASAYSKSLTAVAASIAGSFVARSLKANLKAWRESGVTRAEIKKSGVGRLGIDSPRVEQIVEKLMADNVELIKSIPIEAAARAQALALESVSTGRRPEEVAKMLEATEGVAINRANLIARDQAAKAAAGFTQERAKDIGATHYVWRTAGDEVVRESHAEMDGQVCEFDNPPTLSDGDTVNPGEAVACRCYAEPILTSTTDAA